jgi:hypothetical protein
VLIHGKAGIGKTSLLRKFVVQRGQPSSTLVAGCEALFAPRPFGPLADLADALPPSIAAALRDGRAHCSLFPGVLTADPREEPGRPWAAAGAQASAGVGFAFHTTRCRDRRRLERTVDSIGIGRCLRYRCGLHRPTAKRLRCHLVIADGLVGPIRSTAHRRAPACRWPRRPRARAVGFELDHAALLVVTHRPIVAEQRERGALASRTMSWLKNLLAYSKFSSPKTVGATSTCDDSVSTRPGATCARA